MITSFIQADYKSKLSSSLVLIGCLLSTNAFAGFEVMEPDYYGDHYGNAQNETFRRAVDSDEPLDANDRAFMASVEENRVGDRWYLKGQLGRSNIQVKNITNDTGGVAGQPQQASVDDDIFMLTLGWGYKWTRWAMEFELMIAEKFGYQSSPIVSGQMFQLESTVRQWALFWDLFYEVPKFFDFLPQSIYPYLQTGAGISIKSTDNESSTLGGQGLQVQTDHTTGFAWHFGLGLKFKITGKLLGDFAYRHMDLGKVKFGPINGTGAPGPISLRSTDVTATGLFLGVTYQL